MNTRSLRTAIFPIFLGLSMITTSTAMADDSLRKIAGRGLRTLKAAAPRARAIPNLSAPSRVRGIPNLKAPTRSRGISSQSPFRGNPDQTLQNLADLGNFLGYSDRSRHHNDSRDYGYPYDPRSYRDDRAYADAYRDVGIANAVVGLVGTIVNGGAGIGYYSDPYMPTYSAPCPRYERVRVLVRDGHYEERRVWVRDGYDSGAGVETGHYEIERVWVPEAYEYRNVPVR